MLLDGEIEQCPQRAHLLVYGSLRVATLGKPLHVGRDLVCVDLRHGWFASPLVKLFDGGFIVRLGPCRQLLLHRQELREELRQCQINLVQLGAATRSRGRGLGRSLKGPGDGPNPVNGDHHVVMVLLGAISLHLARLRVELVFASLPEKSKSLTFGLTPLIAIRAVSMSFSARSLAMRGSAVRRVRLICLPCTRKCTT